MKRLELYFISNDYINYLRKYDNRVFFNKNAKRPYVGVVYKYNNFNYFAPLASPKPKHLHLKASKDDIFKISGGELGIININNMIPTPEACLKLVWPLIDDSKYETLLKKQISYLNAHREVLIHKIERFQDLYHSGNLKGSLKNRCCDFKLLEEKCLEYENNILIKN